jgi:hypothetical protein
MTWNPCSVLGTPGGPTARHPQRLSTYLWGRVTPSTHAMAVDAHRCARLILYIDEHALQRLTGYLQDRSMGSSNFFFLAVLCQNLEIPAWRRENLSYSSHRLLSSLRAASNCVRAQPVTLHK